MLSPSLFLPYLVIAVVVTILAARRAKTPWRRRGAIAGSILAFWLFAHIDQFIGDIQHQWLCKEEGGFFVYKRPQLPPTMFDANGEPLFLSKNGLNREMLSPYLRFQSTTVRNYRQFPLAIDKHIVQVVSIQPEILLAEIKTFSAWPSQFIPRFGHVSAQGCLESSEESHQWKEWEKRVFDLKK